jgi:hypothetical protein
MTQDSINGLFGVFASILSYQNVRQAILHNEIKGMHWHSTAFFTAWAIFQLYFYFDLKLYLSMVGSFCIILIDLYWLWLFYKFSKFSLSSK